MEPLGTFKGKIIFEEVWDKFEEEKSMAIRGKALRQDFDFWGFGVDVSFLSMDFIDESSITLQL